ncbi:protein of unknown function (plasmid) [Shinella sp. WSC3-e]|nr:protein of unknown function [Shinella sp. WSC3-e]
MGGDLAQGSEAATGGGEEFGELAHDLYSFR